MFTQAQEKPGSIHEKGAFSLVNKTEENLKDAYEFVYQPFEINKFPFETLGFGIYMAYFSFLLTNNDNQAFLARKKLYEGEKVVRSYQSEVLGNLTAKNVGNMSLFEMVEILHHNNIGNNDFLLTLKNEMKCDSNGVKQMKKEQSCKK